jgi:hypothetical protein
MSKKEDLLLPSFLREEPKEKPKVLPHSLGRPKSKVRTKETGCREGETRFTTILDKELVENARKLAYWDRRTVKAVFTLAMEEYIRNYEKKNGKLKPVPER